MGNLSPTGARDDEPLLLVSDVQGAWDPWASQSLGGVPVF